MSAVELAIDVHAIRVIATNNYQQCIRAIWHGFYTVQHNDGGRLAFAEYPLLLSRRILDHFDPQRMKGTHSQPHSDGSSAIPEHSQFSLHIALPRFVYNFNQ